MRGVSSEKSAAEVSAAFFPTFPDVGDDMFPNSPSQYEQEVRALHEDNAALRQQLQDAHLRAQRSEEEARRLQTQLEQQEAVSRRLQVQLDSLTARQQAAAYMPQYTRRYIPSSASSGSLHSLVNPGVAPTSLNDLSSVERARKGKQTMC